MVVAQEEITLIDEDSGSLKILSFKNAYSKILCSLINKINTFENKMRSL